MEHHLDQCVPLGCSAGFEILAVEDGHCTLTELAQVDSVAVYSGWSVTCSLETEANGQMSESYCRREAMLDFRELAGAEGVVCAADVPPTTALWSAPRSKSHSRMDSKSWSFPVRKIGKE